METLFWANHDTLLAVVQRYPLLKLSENRQTDLLPSPSLPPNHVNEDHRNHPTPHLIPPEHHLIAKHFTHPLLPYHGHTTLPANADHCTPVISVT
jgi:hypothetical protein